MDIELNNGRITVPRHPELSACALNVHHAEAGDGIALPIIIHNGDWFVSNGFFYGSGYADCWQMGDAEHLSQNINKGWLAARIPERSKTNFGTLGYRQTDDGHWLFDRETYKAHALGLLNQLPRSSEPRPQPSQRLLSKTVFYRQDGEKREAGKSFTAAYRYNGLYYFVNLVVYADGSIEIGYLPEKIWLHRESITEALDNGDLSLSPPAGTRLHIGSLGSVLLHDEYDGTDADDFLLELDDALAQLNGLPTTGDKFLAAAEAYQTEPSPENKQRVKAAFEAMPSMTALALEDELWDIGLENYWLKDGKE